MLKVVKRFTFEAAHRLPNHLGHCNRLHGHSYKLDVGVMGLVKVETGPNVGMIIDFSELSNIVETEVISNVDHTCLNDILSNPTAERLVTYVVTALSSKLEKKGLLLCLVRVHETEDSYAEWVA